MGIEHKNRKEYHAKYIRQHYQDNKQYYLDKANARKLRIQTTIRNLKDVPCKDCTLKYPYYVMQFDHLPEFEKSFDLSTAHLRGYSEAKILAEVAKCEVVCANCHAERTHVRQSYNG